MFQFQCQLELYKVTFSSDQVGDKFKNGKKYVNV